MALATENHNSIPRRAAGLPPISQGKEAVVEILQTGHLTQLTASCKHIRQFFLGRSHLPESWPRKELLQAGVSGVTSTSGHLSPNFSSARLIPTLGKASPNRNEFCWRFSASLNTSLQNLTSQFSIIYKSDPKRSHTCTTYRGNWQFEPRCRRC